MANNYTPSYNQYRTQTAGYALPSSVKTYSVFDPASNSWRKMTNDGMSPMPQGNQPDIQAALAQARQTQGTVYPTQGMGQGQPVEMHPGYLNPPVQAPAQMPSRGSRTPSPASGGGGAVPVQGQPANEAVTLTGPSTDARGISLNPNLNYPFRSNFENFQQEIPRSNAYGPLQNPRTVKNMSPDYQEATAAPVAVTQPTPAAPAASVQPVRAVGYPTTDIFGNDQFWRQANHYNERDAQLNELRRDIRHIGDAALFHSPIAFTLQLPRGLAAYSFGPTTEPLAGVTRVAKASSQARRVLTPQAQKIADSLKFTFGN